MNLIDCLKGKLLLTVELQPEGTYFCRTLPGEYLTKLDNVLGAFQKGDAERFDIFLEDLGGRISIMNRKMLERYSKAAKLMETSDG